MERKREKTVTDGAALRTVAAVVVAAAGLMEAEAGRGEELFSDEGGCALDDEFCIMPVAEARFVPDC